MTVKKSLENRIRGWFPQEPTLIAKSLQVDNEYKQQPQIIPPEYKTSATKAAGKTAILWIILGYGLFFFSLEKYLTLLQILAWIIAGIAVGVISESMRTKNQLSRISRDYLITQNRKETAMLFVPIILFVFFSGFVSWFLYSNLLVLLFSFYFLLGSSQLTRVILFAAFERKENMRLMQSMTGRTIILVPKPPNRTSTV